MMREFESPVTNRLGNRHADTYLNIIRDADILETMAVNGKVPILGLAVHVQEAFFHCSKCMVRSGLWSPEQWPSLDGLSSLADAVVDPAKLKVPKKNLDIVIKRDAKKRLY